ncbi:MAG TPA: winged helix-turn-helix domain-containing protein [Armatimonadaceae bacterium]|nr:winged helix-turn-helix domain-containing protein [Armatimonadaceae bacterium]
MGPKETRDEGAGGAPAPSGWTFLSNHAHVLICLGRDPGVRLRDVAERVGITERAVQRIVADLEEAGVITRTRDGRRNHYDIHHCKPLRHPIEAHATVGALLAAVVSPGAAAEPQTAADSAPADESDDRQ